MNAANWLSRQLQTLLHVTPQDEAAKPSRTTRERLDATLRREQEALTPGTLRKTLQRLRAVVDAQVSEVEGAKRAGEVIAWYAGADAQARADLWQLMSEQFGPDPIKVHAAREQYDSALGSQDEGVAEIRLRRALLSPRTRLMQRFAACPGGMRFLVDMRADILAQTKGSTRFAALEAELENLFSTWFDVAFLELRSISWDSPASLIEKLIKYEAVHDIRSWADVKNRLDSDRRCYGFFHPNLPNEPLIFVEVALLHDLADSITPLLDEAAAPEDLKRATVAIFYSISNTQTGLRGVSFGDSLIKRVVETLRQEFPKLRTFATLSPIPGLRAWLTREAEALLALLSEKDQQALAKELQDDRVSVDHVLLALEQAPLLEVLSPKSPLRQFLMRAAAQYVSRTDSGGHVVDSVARFHLGNGARIERINWYADPSPKGHKQSYGLMVNYLYDLKRLDKHRHMLVKGNVPASDEVSSLYFF